VVQDQLDELNLFEADQVEKFRLKMFTNIWLDDPLLRALVEYTSRASKRKKWHFSNVG
jgi:hypothetical protein